MLKIDHLSISFEKQTVFNDACFFTKRGYLTLIIGESGSGKSTLINEITFKTKYANEYIIDNINIREKEETTLKKYTREHISTVYQNDALLNDITVKEHIDLLEKMFGSTVETSLIERLELTKLLDKYPNQLSGGELTRVLLLLAMIKNPDILILDEPTSSLDDVHSDIVILLLKEYAEKGNIVIVSTHDTRMIEKGDIIYQIQNNKLDVTGEFDKEDIKEDKIAIFSTKALGRLFYRLKKHKKFNTVCMLLLSSIMLGFSIFSLNFINYASAYQEENVSQLGSTELTVFKSPDGLIHETLSAGGYEFPLTIAEKEVLQNTKHIKSIRGRMDMFLTIYSPGRKVYEFIGQTFSAEEKSYKKEVEFLFKVSNNKQVLYNSEKSGSFQNQEKYQGNTLVMSTYREDIEYSKDIQYKFQEEGVYLPSAFASMLGIKQEDWKNAVIEMDIIVPIYNASGFSEVGRGINSDIFPANHVLGKIVRIKTKVAGLLKGTKMGENSEGTVTSIFFLDTELVNYVNQYRINTGFEEPNTVYEGRKIVYAPWDFNTYSVVVDSITNVPTVVKDLQEKGFSVQSTYVNASQIGKSIEVTQEVYQVWGYTVLLIVFLMSIGMKRHNVKEEQRFNTFFITLGFDRKQMWILKSKKYIYNTILMFLVSVVVLVMIVWFANRMMMGYTELTVKMFIMLLLLVLLIEWGYPMFLEKRCNHG